MAARNVTDHFDGKRFFNPNGTCRKGFRDVWRWMRTRQSAKWPDSVANPHASHSISTRAAGQGAVTFIGHSTFLLQLGETNILLDPVYSMRASPVTWVGPKRVRPPAIDFEHLPPIDLVLVSHCHYDHLDLHTLRRLRKRNKPTVVTPLMNGRIVAKAGIKQITELDWWQSSDFRNLRITVTPAQHFTARKFSDRNKALWGGFIIEGEGRTIFYAGDTGYAEHFEQIGERFSRIDLALLPIGAYEPRWFMTEYHMNPAEAVQAFVELRARRALAMHFGTFQLTDEAIDAPAFELQRELQQRGVKSEMFLVPEFGQTLNL